MSFSSDLKQTIIDHKFKNACCRRSLLLGALSAKAHITKENEISFNADGSNTIDYISDLIHEFYNTSVTVSAPSSGGRCKKASFFAKSLYTMLSDEEEIGKVLSKLKCPLCKSAFLRGIYLLSGRATDPEKQFCLEFSLGNRLNCVVGLLSECGIDLKTAKRKSEMIAYTKNSTVIEDFFAMAELKEAAFCVMNVKITKDLKNEANRVRNFETVNISRAVEAASMQYSIIKELSERRLIGKLPDELKPTALMRLNNPYMSLSQLAMHSTPPLSKSGITHRMDKIIKLAKELLSK